MKKISSWIIVFLVASVLHIEAQNYTHVGVLDCEYHTQHQKTKLFHSVGCHYSNDMNVVSADCLVNPYSTHYFKSNSSVVKSLSEKYGKDVVARKLAPMYLKFISPQIGYGIFAAQRIKKDDFIGVYAGDLRYVAWSDPKFNEDVDYAWYYAVDGASGKKMIVDGKYRGNELRFINHANSPNTKRIDVVVNGKFYICYVATKDIAQGAQLTVSYGEGYWNSRNINPENVS